MLTGHNITRGVQLERVEGYLGAGNTEIKTAALPMGAVNSGGLVYDSIAWLVGVGNLTAGSVKVVRQQSVDDVDANYTDLQEDLVTTSSNTLVVAEITRPGKVFVRLRIERAGTAEITHVTALRTPVDLPAVHGSEVAAVTSDDFISTPFEVS